MKKECCDAEGPGVGCRLPLMNLQAAQSAWLYPSSGHGQLQGLRPTVRGQWGLNRFGVLSSRRDDRDEEVFKAGLMVTDHGSSAM